MIQHRVRRAFVGAALALGVCMTPVGAGSVAAANVSSTSLVLPTAGAQTLDLTDNWGWE